MLIAQQSEKYAFECAINAFACMSQSDIFRSTLIEKGCVTALVGAVIGKTDILVTIVRHFICDSKLQQLLIDLSEENFLSNFIQSHHLSYCMV